MVSAEAIQVEFFAVVGVVVGQVVECCISVTAIISIPCF